MNIRKNYRDANKKSSLPITARSFCGFEILSDSRSTGFTLLEILKRSAQSRLAQARLDKPQKLFAQVQIIVWRPAAISPETNCFTNWPLLLKMDRFTHPALGKAKLIAVLGLNGFG